MTTIDIVAQITKAKKANTTVAAAMLAAAAQANK